LEEFAGAIAEIAEGNGDFCTAGEMKQIDRGVAKGGKILRPVTGFYLALVLAERDIAHPMQAIFNTPVAAPTPYQKRRVSPFARKAGDGVLNLDRRAAFALGRTFETADLSQAGPIEMPGQPRTGLQMPPDTTAMSLGNRTRFRERCLSLLFGGGGKNRAENPLPQRPSVRADCP